jgi:O-antigen ligase
MQNGLQVVSQSPIVGWGAGSFSGIRPFSAYEAHSTPIDLAMQFGIFFPILFYSIMIVAMFKKLKDKEYLVAAFIMGFIFSGFFHYSARHFTFWVELSIFYSHAFHNYLKNNKPTTT